MRMAAFCVVPADLQLGNAESGKTQDGTQKSDCANRQEYDRNRLHYFFSTPAGAAAPSTDVERAAAGR